MTDQHPASVKAYWAITPSAAIGLDDLALLAALLAIIVGTAVGLFTRMGSGIGTHPWGNRRSLLAPGATDHDELSGRDEREHADPSFGAH